MTLREFKRLEAKEIAFDKISSGKKGSVFIYRFGPYAGDWVIIDDEANAKLLQDYERALAEVQRLQRGFWQRIFP